jgi:ABC-2 type transport system permease protein
MTGFATFLKKELREVFKTWRLWVLPGILVFLGVTAPVITKITPQILKATAQSTPGVVIRFPTPTALDAYVQFLANIAQLVVIALIIATAAAISSERKSGTAVLMLTKPLSRPGFVVAKAVSQLVVVVAATALASAICIAVTVALFGTTRHIGPFLVSVVVWLVFAGMLIMLTLLCSAWFRGQAPAAGTAVGVWIALLALTGFPLIRDHSPAGLIAMNDAFLRHRDIVVAWPLVTTVALGVAFLLGAVWAFERSEL